MRRARRVHGKLGTLQQRVELVGAGADRHQSVSAGVVMIKSAGKAFAFVDGEVEFERVAGTRRRIWSCGVCDFRSAGAVVDAACPSREDVRGAIEKPRKLDERDRSLIVEMAGRVTFTQELRDRRDRPRMPG